MKIGDHLITGRGVYSHHGLYLGDEKVIHYAGSSTFLNKVGVSVTSLDEFTQGKKVTVNRHLLSLYTAEERIERALSRLGECSYNVVFNNCEHFVNWCFYNISFSAQTLAKPLFIPKSVVQLWLSAGVFVCGVLYYPVMVENSQKDKDQNFNGLRYVTAGYFRADALIFTLFDQCKRL